MLSAEGTELVICLPDITDHLHICELLYLVQVYHFVIVYHEVGVGQNSATGRRVERGRVRTEIRNGGPDRFPELAEGLTNGLVQPIHSWGTLQMLINRAEEVSDYLGRLRNMVFGLFR